VQSALLHNDTAMRVTVVAHNIDRDIIAGNLDDMMLDERVRVLSHNDQIHSPAGPMNLGLSEATAPFVTIIGSDDEFEPGAIDSWLRLQRQTNAAMVITRTLHEGRGFDAFPPVRPRRHIRLDPVSDRLAYQSAPLGLIDRQRLGHLRFSTHLLSGEDIPYSLQVWFSGFPLAIDREGPGYRVHHDASDRVSFTPRAVEQDFAFLDDVLNVPWFAALTARQKQAIVVKILRTQFFDAIGLRVQRLADSDEVRQSLAHVLGRLLNSAPGAVKFLSRIDRQVLDAVFTHALSGQAILTLLEKRWHYRSIPAVLPRNPLLALHTQGPLRTLHAGFMMKQPPRRLL